MACQGMQITALSSAQHGLSTPNVRSGSRAPGGGVTCILMHSLNRRQQGCKVTPGFSRGQSSALVRQSSSRLAGPSSSRVCSVRAQVVVVDDPSTVTREEAEQLVEEVRLVLERDHASLPCGAYGRDDVAMIDWFLRDRKYQVDAAVAKLCKAIKWRHEFGVASLTAADVEEEALTGKAYLHDGTDIAGRPVIVVDAGKHFPNEARLKASEQLCVFLIERALERLPPGEERFLGVFDLSKFSHRNADITFVRFLIDVFFNYYPKRLEKVLFIDAPFIFQPGWKVMKPLLKSYANLVEFCSAKEAKAKHFPHGGAPKSL